MDLVFMLDSSGSIRDAPGGIGNWNGIKQFVSDILAHLDVGREYVRVGVITYSTHGRTELNIIDGFDGQYVRNVVLNLGFIGSFTNMADAIELMLREFNGPGNRPFAPDIAIMIGT